MTLLTLVSRQLWTQVLVMQHLAPESVVLLHTDNGRESRLPAERLKTFLDNPPATVAGGHGTVPAQRTLREIPNGQDLGALIGKLDQIFDELQLDPETTLLNATGGQRLMTAGAVEWARNRGVGLVFLDRQREITHLRFTNNTWRHRPEPALIDPVAEWDPNAMLLLQADQPLIGPGQWLALSDLGRRMTMEDLRHDLAKAEPADFAPLLRRLDSTEPLHVDGKAGTPLELKTAIWLLRAGVPGVRVGATLAVQANLRTGPDEKLNPDPAGRDPDEEIDVHFVHDGRLWLVETKDRKSESQALDQVRKWLNWSNAPYYIRESLTRAKSQIEGAAMQSLKLDLLSARRFGGIQAEVIRVTRTPLSAAVAKFAERQRVHVVVANDLPTAFETILWRGSARRPSPPPPLPPPPTPARRYIIT